MGATLTTLSNLLKDWYLPPVREQLNNDVLLLQRLEVNAEDLQGNQAVVPVHSARTGAIGSRAEGGTLPSARNQSWARATYNLTFHYGRIQVTGPSISATRSDRGAFLQSLRSELDFIRNDLKKDMARQSYGASDLNTAGGAAFIAQCGTTSSSNTIVLNTREAIDKGHIHVGMRVDIGTTGDEDSLVADERVDAVDASGPNFDVTTSVTTSTSNYVSRTDNRAGTTEYEMAGGLDSLLQTSAGSYGSINASTAGNEYWDNLRMLNSGTGRALTLDLMLQAFNTVAREGGNVTAMISNLGVQRQFFNLLQSQVRYTEPMKIEGGFSTLEFHGRPLIADVDCHFGRIYFLDEPDIMVFSPEDWHFLAEDGQTLKWVQDQDAWQSALTRYMEMGARRRNNQLVLGDISDTTGL